MRVAARECDTDEPVRRQPEIETGSDRPGRARVIGETGIRVAHFEPGYVSGNPAVVLPGLALRDQDLIIDDVEHRGASPHRRLGKVRNLTRGDDEAIHEIRLDFLPGCGKMLIIGKEASL